MDKLNEIIEILESKIEHLFKNESSGHNMGHLKRTLNYALYLQQKEGGDREVIGVSAFIHDIHRILSTNGKYVSPRDSLPVVKEIISDIPLSENQKEHILYAIEHHEEYNFGKEKVKVEDIESKILQDADNLDAIGAIGIVRCFQYGVAHNAKEYDSNVPLYQNEYYEGGEDASSIHHIYNKLMRLGDYMNTETARGLADKKIKFMDNFCKTYISEYEGNID